MEIEVSYNRFKNKIHIMKKGWDTFCGLSTGSIPQKVDAILFLNQNSTQVCNTCRKGIHKILKSTNEF